VENITINELQVVVVEPSITQQHIIKNQLDAIGITSIHFEQSGSASLDHIKKYIPDLVISALYLPDMTGTELLESIHADESLNELAFMLISSETNLNYLDPIRQAGAVAILPKPFTTNELSIALESVMDYLTPSDYELDDFDFETTRILIVDDSPLARKYIRRMLNSLGIKEITEASDGNEATALISNGFFDLIITDYNMPEMDGQELVAYIREQSSQSSVPVIMVTSEQDGGRLAAIQKAGVSAIFDKPLETSPVRKLITQLLSNQ
jgi:two-component system chemotaxis response regulator CheY